MYQEREGQEPWYYGFIEGYTSLVMWLGIISVVVIALLVIGGTLVAYSSMQQHDGPITLGTSITVLITLSPPSRPSSPSSSGPRSSTSS